MTSFRSSVNCRDDYKKYKDICKLDVFEDRCKNINSNSSIKDLLVILKDYSIRKDIFLKCRIAREKYSKKCYESMDEGHRKHINFLEREEQKCNNLIKKIQELLKEKEKLLNESKKNNCETPNEIIKIIIT